MKNDLAEKIEKLMDLEGEVKGVAIKSELDFILNREGSEGLKKVEDKIGEFGYDLEREKISDMKLYPLGLYGSIQLAVKELFDYQEKEFREMGAFEAKMSLIMRLFMRYFVSIDVMANQVSKMWRTYFTTGELEVVKINKKERCIVADLKDFKIHKLQCNVLVGYFASVIQMVTGTETTCEETKCPFSGDGFHRFLVRW
ncbi:MAG: hypothetical protein GF370_00875 [Candidatus Nealsonbacteria bacterium]|nr:hypothetical protein [Candidatus Nealsonbacteria bacterium]